MSVHLLNFKKTFPISVNFQYIKFSHWFRPSATYVTLLGILCFGSKFEWNEEFEQIYCYFFFNFTEFWHGRPIQELIEISLEVERLGKSGRHRFVVVKEMREHGFIPQREPHHHFTRNATRERNSHSRVPTSFLFSNRIWRRLQFQLGLNQWQRRLYVTHFRYIRLRKVTSEERLHRRITLQYISNIPGIY